MRFNFRGIFRQQYIGLDELKKYLLKIKFTFKRVFFHFNSKVYPLLGRMLIVNSLVGNLHLLKTQLFLWLYKNTNAQPFILIKFRIVNASNQYFWAYYHPKIGNYLKLKTKLSL